MIQQCGTLVSTPLACPGMSCRLDLSCMNQALCSTSHLALYSLWLTLATPLTPFFFMDKFLCIVLQIYSCVVHHGCVQQQIFLNVVRCDILCYHHWQLRSPNLYCTLPHWLVLVVHRFSSDSLRCWVQYRSGVHLSVTHHSNLSIPSQMARTLDECPCTCTQVCITQILVLVSGWADIHIHPGRLPLFILDS